MITNLYTMEHKSSCNRPLLDVVTNYYKAEMAYIESQVIDEAKTTIKPMSVADDDPILFYLSISG